MNINRGCVFCGSGCGLTREHVLPDWLKCLYPKEVIVVNELIGSEVKTWPSKMFEHKVRVVCPRCNNGWMSTLESGAKPLITKLVGLQALTITSKEQNLLAFWAQKTLLMLNQSVPEQIKITKDLYEDIYTNKGASRKVLVNIGWRMLTDGTKDQPIVSFYLKQVTSVDVPVRLHSQVTEQKDAGGFVWKALFAIGPLIFEMMGHNMQVTLNVSTNSRVVTPLAQNAYSIKWPLEWPIESEGGLSALINR